MTKPNSSALRILSRFWLEEVQPGDLALIAALPELPDTLAQQGAAGLTDLAVEYQRLFGLNLPPYESVFVDPSAMLMSPATDRVQRLYDQAGWAPPPGARTGAPDHLGLELLALADWSEEGRSRLASRLHRDHLALWAPACTLALQALSPHPFYAALGDLTREMVLATLDPDSAVQEADPFPFLPPPPVYRAHGMPPPVEGGEDGPVALRDILRRLLTPREAGVFLTRQDILRAARALELPEVMGERFRMLESLFRLAGQYDLVPALFDRLAGILAEADAAYQRWEEEYPAWRPHAAAWRRRLASTAAALREFRQEAEGSV
jgi:TorA maturation chaperone TorD